MTDIVKALEAISPTAEWVLVGQDYSGLRWDSPNLVKPTEAEIDAKIVELQAEYDANQYQRDRQPEYPSIQDQLDMQYWDKVNGTNTWQEAIASVKANHPKPE